MGTQFLICVLLTFLFCEQNDAQRRPQNWNPVPVSASPGVMGSQDMQDPQCCSSPSPKYQVAQDQEPSEDRDQWYQSPSLSPQQEEVNSTEPSSMSSDGWSVMEDQQGEDIQPPSTYSDIAGSQPVADQTPQPSALSSPQPSDPTIQYVLTQGSNDSDYLQAMQLTQPNGSVDNVQSPPPTTASDTAPSSTNSSSDSQSGGTVDENCIIQALQELFGDILAILQETGVISQMQPGYTLFVPTNQAARNFTDGQRIDFQDLFLFAANIAALEEIMQLHVVEDQWTIELIENQQEKKTSPSLLENQSLDISNQGIQVTNKAEEIAQPVVNEETLVLQIFQCGISMVAIDKVLTPLVT